MKGEITKIHKLKSSQTEASFIRIEFKMEDGSWAKTDIVPIYRNYKRWKPIIKRGVGTVLKNLEFRTPNEIDADSFPLLVTPEVAPQINMFETLKDLPEKAGAEWEKLREKFHPKRGGGRNDK